MSRMQRIYIPLHSLDPATIPAGTRAIIDPWDALTVAEDEGYPFIVAFLTSPLENGRTVKALDTRRPLRIYVTRKTSATGDRLIDLVPDEPRSFYARARA